MFLEYEITQHPVGQGFFHSGCVNLRRNGYELFRQIAYVYDCGTISKRDSINSEVVNFVSKLGHAQKSEKPIIELLYISHFHLDHINRVKTLLTTAKVKKAFALVARAPQQR